MPRTRRRNVRDLVIQRSRILYRLALDYARRGDVEQARRLGERIIRLSLATRTRLPRSIRRGLCRRCHAPLIPGVTARVRLRRDGRSAYISVACLNCGWITRYRYKPERRAERRRSAKEKHGGSKEPGRDNR